MPLNLSAALKISAEVAGTDQIKALASETDNAGKAATRTQEAGLRLVSQLQKEVAEFGKSREELIRMKAAQLGVGESAGHLVDQLEHLREKQGSTGKGFQGLIAHMKILGNSSVGVSEKMTVLKGAMAGLSEIAAVAWLAEGTKKAIENADAMGKQAQMIGMSTSAYSALSYAAGALDIQQDSLTTALKKLSVTMVDAHSGVKLQAAAYTGLGISITDAGGKMRSTESVLGDVAEKFSHMENGAVKTKLAVQLFGRAGVEMIPMLNRGKDGIKELTGEAKKLGVVVSDDTAAQATRFDESMKRMSEGTKGLFLTAAKDLLPTLNDVMDSFGLSSDESGIFSTAMKAIGEVIRYTVTPVLAALDLDLKTIANGLSFLGESMIAMLHGDFGKVRTLAKQHYSEMISDGNEFITKMKHLVDTDPIFGTPDKVAKPQMRGKLSDGSSVLASLHGAQGGHAKADPFKAQLTSLDEQASKLDSQVGHFQKYGEAVTSSKEAEAEFLVTTGKFAHESQVRKDALVSEARHIDELTKKLKIMGSEKAFMDQVRQINSATEAIGKSNREREISVKLAELEKDGLAKGSAEYNTYAKAMTDAINAKYDAQGKFDIKKWVQQQDESIARMREENSLIGMNTTQRKLATDAMNIDAEVRKKIVGLSKDDAKALLAESEKIKAERAEVIAGQSGISNAWQSSTQKMSNALAQFSTTGKLNFKSLSSSIIQDIVRMQMQAESSQIFGMLSSAGADSGGIFSSISGLFGGGRASGGSTAAGSSYVVGENGPELFTPTQSGSIAPNNQRMSGGTMHQVVNIDARGADAGVEMKIHAAMNQASQNAVAMVMQNINRGGAIARQVGVA